MEFTEQLAKARQASLAEPAKPSQPMPDEKVEEEPLTRASRRAKLKPAPAPCKGECRVCELLLVVFQAVCVYQLCCVPLSV